MSLAARVCLALALASTASCAFSREGWGRGRYVVVSESSTLQVRRSTVRIETVTGDLVMNWIGARAPAGSPLIANMIVTVFEDLDGDRAPGADEIRSRRECGETSSKLLFSDVRVPAASIGPGLRASVQVRTAEGALEALEFPFQPDL